MANKANTSDQGNPAFNKLTNDQIASILNSATGDPTRAQFTADNIPPIYKKYPQMLAGMNLGGTFVPNSGGLSGGQIQGGMTAANLAGLISTFAPQPQQQQTPQYQMPSLGPAQQTPTVQTTPLAATTPYGGIGAGAQTAAPAQPAASAQQASAFFNPQQQPQLGVQPLQPGQYAPPQLPPLPQYQQPQRFQGGGLVQSDQQVQNQPVNIQQSDQGANTGIYNPLYLGSYLGALALGGQPMVVNPSPTGTPSAKSGVSAVGGPQYYATGQGGWQMPGGGPVFTQDQVNSLPSPQREQVQGIINSGALPRVSAQPQGAAAQGPWMNVPGIFKQAPMPTIQGGGITPLVARTPANAAQMPQAGPTPTYAQQISAPMPAGVNFGQITQGAPPPAPGVSLGAAQQPAPLTHDFLQAHTSALADAGKAMYAHFGGDPNTATHSDIANFHTELQGALAGGPPIKRRSGGIVPGVGNSDSVPARLTPGEFVVNKDAVQNIGVGNLQAMNAQRFQGGGEVLPRETRHKALTADSSSSPSSAPPAAQQDSDQTPSSSSGTIQGPAGQSYIDMIARAQAARTMQQNAALRVNTPAYPAATTPAAQGYAAAANAGQIGGAAPSAAQIQGAAAMSPAQTQSSIAGANAGAASAIGGLGSAISQAFDTYAKSIGSWNIQPYKEPFGSGISRPQTVTLSQEGT